MHDRRWTLNSVPKLRAVFTDADTGERINPSAVSLVVKRPNGSVTTYTFGDSAMTNPENGVFVFPLMLDTKGTYRWRFEGSMGANAGDSAEGKLDAYSDVT